MTGLRIFRLNSIEWADHVAEIIDRKLRETDDPRERDRLLDLRNWHYATAKKTA
jgi:hypothetical protein